MRGKENRGFTLIELLAVIVILGVIMLIAVPSISNVITNARKDAYIRSAKAYIDAASKAIVSGEITAPLEGSSTYLKISELEIENGSQQSPFGSIFQEEKSYVKITNVSTNNVTKYQYAIALSDHKDNCIALTNREDLKRGSVSTGCSTLSLGEGYLSLSNATSPIDLGLTNYDFKDSMTMVLRARLKASDRYQAVCGNWEAAGTGIEYYASKGISFDLYIANQGYIHSPRFSVAMMRFYTIVATYNGSQMDLYVDGTLIGSTPANGNIVPSKVPFLLGANPALGGKYSDGAEMDVTDVLIFDRAMTSEEVRTYYQGEIHAVDRNQLLVFESYHERG